tara:strand:+ start:182 stop:448 length:267 start_codon:yes stop_codon:yes gene_type:complete
MPNTNMNSNSNNNNNNEVVTRVMCLFASVTCWAMLKYLILNYGGVDVESASVLIGCGITFFVMALFGTGDDQKPPCPLRPRGARYIFG